MKILVVHEVSYLRKVIYEMHEFPELLALRGHEITFVDFDEGATRETRAKPRERTIQGRIHAEAKIRLVTPHAFGIPAIDRIWAIFSSVPVFIRLFYKSKFDVVLNYAVPTYAIQLALVARLFRVPVVYRALDIPSRIRKLAWNPLIYLYEFLAYLLPQKLSANNPAMSVYLASRIPKFRQKDIVVQYPPLDFRIFRPIDREVTLQSSLGIRHNDRVMMYMGSFFYFSGLDEVIETLAPILRRRPNLKLLLIGGGELEPELRNLVLQLRLDKNVIITGFVPFHDLPRYMALGDVAINPLRNSLVATAAFPHKVLQYMAMGIPTATTRLDGLYAAFGDHSGLVWASNPKEVANAGLDLLRAKKSALKKRTNQQIQTVQSMFSPEATVKKLEDSLQKLADRKKPK